MIASTSAPAPSSARSAPSPSTSQAARLESRPPSDVGAATGYAEPAYITNICPTKT